MKILYVGNYRDQGSLGRVCRDYLLSLIEAGADIVARPVFHTAPFVKSLDPRILKAESKDSKGAEVCVQQLHYSQLLADTRFKKNVAVVGFRAIPPKREQSLIDARLAPFDDTICVNSVSQFVVGKLGDVVYPHPIDVKISEEKPQKDKFVFYFIGKLSQRKNLDALVTAFHREFNRDEPVELLIKTSCDIDQNQAALVIDKHLSGIKTKLGKYANLDKYKRESLVLNELLDENWGAIHSKGDCLVMPSCGEYTSLVPSIALCYGNEVIINNTIGLDDLPGGNYFKENAKGIGVCQSNEIFIEDSRCANLTNFEETKGSKWYEPSIASLQACMRRAFQLPANLDKTINISRQSVGEQLLSRILK